MTVPPGSVPPRESGTDVFPGRLAPYDSPCLPRQGFIGAVSRAEAAVIAFFSELDLAGALVRSLQSDR